MTDTDDLDTIELTEEGLDALLSADALEEDPTASPAAGFTPDTAERVDWVLGKIADAKERARRVREHAEVMAKQAEAEATFFEWKYGAALQEFARRELAGGRRKSLTLYHGVIGFRTKPAAFTFDEPAAIAWAREHRPAALAYRLDRQALAEALRFTEGGGVALADTGEVVPFATVRPAEVTFFIK